MQPTLNALAATVHLSAEMETCDSRLGIEQVPLFLSLTLTKVLIPQEWMSFSVACQIFAEGDPDTHPMLVCWAAGVQARLIPQCRFHSFDFICLAAKTFRQPNIMRHSCCRSAMITTTASISISLPMCDEYETKHSRKISVEKTVYVVRRGARRASMYTARSGTSLLPVC